MTNKKSPKKVKGILPKLALGLATLALVAAIGSVAQAQLFDGISPRYLIEHIENWYEAATNQDDSLGSALTYSGATGRIELYNYLNGIAQDLNAIASSTGQGLRATASWDPGAISSTTQATTTLTVTGAALGDFVVASFDSATSTDAWVFSGKVSAADTVMVTLFVPDGGDGASLNLTTSTIYAKVFKQAAVTLQTTTSSSP